MDRNCATRRHSLARLVVGSMFDSENTPPTLIRLIALMGAGYRIDERASSEVGDTIWLEHPAQKRAAEKTLLLSGDGWVFGMDPFDETKSQLRIGPDKSEEFSRFVAAVPKSTWWERNHAPFYMVLAWVIIAGIMLASAFDAS